MDHVSTFLDVAVTDPHRTAVIDPEGREVTFGTLAARVNQLTHALRALGLVPGDGITAIVHNGIPFFELALAAWQSGLYFTPVNYRSSADEIGYIVGNSGAKVVIAEAAIAETCTERLDELGVPPTHRFAIGGAPGWEDYADFGADEPTSVPEGLTMGQSMLYTSGTTGRPKGVRRPLPGGEPVVPAVALASLELMNVHPGTGVHLVTCPLYHAAPGAFSTNSLHLGHTLVVMAKFDAEATLRLIEQHAVTETHLVPTMFHRMLQLPDEVRGRYDTSSLRSVMHGAAPCPRGVKERMIEWFGPVVYEYYGASEGMVTVVDSKEWLTEPGTVGKPLPGVTVKVVDELGEPVPTGETGTLYYRSAQTKFSYHNDPEKTAANRDGEFITVGDIGYVDAAGRVFLCDRRTDLILTGGVNVYPAEIEGRLLEHPEVADAAVIGEPDPEWGQRVVAVIQPRPGVLPGDDLAERLAAHCREKLAGFKTPRRFEFRDRLPRTESGKMLRRSLRTPS